MHTIYTRGNLHILIIYDKKIKRNEKKKTKLTCNDNLNFKLGQIKMRGEV